MKALRLFVVRVSASVRSQDPPSADLARDLLAPIENWQRTARKKAATEQPPTADPAAAAGGSAVKQAPPPTR